jgi:hypothetical protein
MELSGRSWHKWCPAGLTQISCRPSFQRQHSTLSNCSFHQGSELRLEQRHDAAVAPVWPAPVDIETIHPMGGFRKHDTWEALEGEARLKHCGVTVP